MDDTDMPDTPGTGRLARELARLYREAGVGTPCGVTRHQLYEGPGVPKTSHNSAAAIVLKHASRTGAADLGAEFLGERSARGSDPGLAVLAGDPPAGALGFARRAQCELVDQDQARAVASGVFLIGLAGTEDGVIGALAAAVLRADGNDGRFVGLHGIRELRGRMTVGDIKAMSGVSAVVDEESEQPLHDDQLLETRDWVRPRVVGHVPIVFARREGGGWVHADSH